ncbi:MAG: hypothetical protein GXY50_10920 [Syntrophomonadaceae bacterium]|nr:hypothetical protein [Syntrophomonadaceae bacterium]
MNKKNVIGIVGAIMIVALVFVYSMVQTSAQAISVPEKAFRITKVMKEMGTTKADLHKYKNTTSTKLVELEKNYPNEAIQVTITFNKPLSEKDLVQIKNEHDIDIHVLRGRTIEKRTNLRGTLQFAVDEDLQFDQEILNHMISSNEAAFQGFIEVVGHIQVENIDKLCQNKLVFLVDPGADQRLVDNPNKKSVPGAFWKLEDCGLVAD